MKKVLGYHACTCLLDMLYVLAPLIPGLGLRRIVAFHFSVVITYWVPLWIVKMNFRQMDNMVDTFFRIIC